MDKRLFIISNRLPINVKTVADKTILQPSSGGLVTAISSYIDYAAEKGQSFSDKHWVGVPGCTPAEWTIASEDLAQENFKYVPVYANKKAYNLYYNGFSNSVIWPLFHYFPSYVEYNENYYEQYIKVNEDFLEVILLHARETDVIWIHDYHLLPLAEMIREKLPNITIGLFLHIPFPSYELFRMMPAKWQESILKGMLGADLIGFHTVDYASYFLKSVQMILGVDNDNFLLKHGNRLIKVDVFPISIDYKKFSSAYNLKEVGKLRAKYKKQMEDKKIIFSVDRLDYTKGVLCRLKAYEKFLSLYPEYVEKVTFIMVIVPSRDNIPKYTERKKEIDEFIGSFNARIGKLSWKPIIYQYTHLEFEDLIAFYTLCDVALITPLRDGMNLVAKEFVVSRQDKRGVLILSEMAGAAKELADAITINPNDQNGLAEKIKEALDMPVDEQEKRISIMQKRIEQYDVNIWAEDFLSQLEAVKEKQKEFEFKVLDAPAKRYILDKYRLAGKRLILLDYDGTLVPFAPLPHQSKPTKALIDVLTNVSSDPDNHVYLVSGRDSHTLEEWLGALPINLISEHGAKSRTADGKWKSDMIMDMEPNWKSIIRTVMEKYVRRCANTFVEEKDYCVVWHYRNADINQSKIRAAEMFSELSGFSNSLNTQVCSGNKIVEVRIKGVDKGSVVKKLVKDNAYDFILACGDDYTDEDMFRVLSNNKNAVTIKIGAEASYAQYNLYTPEMTVSLLEFLTKDYVLSS